MKKREYAVIEAPEDDNYYAAVAIEKNGKLIAGHYSSNREMELVNVYSRLAKAVKAARQLDR